MDESHSAPNSNQFDAPAPSSLPADDTVTESQQTAVTEAAGDELAEELPPVEPPSAGFIMQLFLVPGLIVAAVIAVWALFGKLSASEQDWRQLVAEVRSNNEHRRWRGATGLAQMLRADIELGEAGSQLSSNPQIAKELADLLTELLNEATQDEELTSQQSFLARTLGWMDSQDEALPPLIEATDSKYEVIVRTDALRSIALIAGRATDAGQPLDRAELTERLLEVSSDKDLLIRQVSAFTLGLIPGDAVDQRLRVMAEDVDANTRINAALAMARRGMPEAVPVFLMLLKTTRGSIDPATMDGGTEAEKLIKARSQENMNQVILGNTLIALRDLSNVLTPEQRAEAVALCQPLAEEAANMKIRVEARTTVQELSEEK